MAKHLNQLPLFTALWWEAAGQRAAYTALAAALPLAALLFTGDVSPLYVLSVVALAALGSLVTSLAGIPEITDKAVPLWRAVLVRVIKTAAQVAAPVLGSVLLLEDVGWYELGVAVAGAALTTLLRTLMAYLPEAVDPLEAAPVGPNGVPVVTNARETGPGAPSARVDTWGEPGAGPLRH